MWDELGISATHDVRLIRKAYAARLRIVQTSKDPAAFQRLRAAYEKALFHAARTVKPVLATPDSARQQPPVETAPEAATMPPPEPSADTLIRIAVGARDIASALTLYERALARGLLPIGEQVRTLDLIMQGPVDDLSLESSHFMALLHRVGWDQTSFGRALSPVHAAAQSRLEAEQWLKHLTDIEQGRPGIRTLLRTTRFSNWAGALLRRGWEQRNARLLLRDQFQLPRLLARSIANLRQLLIQFHHHEAWLKGRISERCISRADRMLASDKRWGKSLRTLFVFVLIGAALALASLSPHTFGFLGGVAAFWGFVIVLRGWILLVKRAARKMRDLFRT